MCMVDMAGLRLWIVLGFCLISVHSEANSTIISAGCRQQALSFLLPYNSSYTPCANELYKMFSVNNDLGFSNIQTKCIGRSSLESCFSINDPVNTMGVQLSDNIDDCELCANRTACQSLLNLLFLNISSSPGSCTTPTSDPTVIFTDLTLIVFMRFQLDIKCSGVYSYDVQDGYMQNLQYLTQCKCALLPCPPGIYCGENQKPEFCPLGHYCPSYGGEKIKCKDGYFCPTGSTKETECAPFAYCPEESSRQYEYAPLALMLVVSAGLFTLHVCCAPPKQPLDGQKADAKESTTKWATPREEGGDRGGGDAKGEIGGSSKSNENLAKLRRQRTARIHIRYENLSLRVSPGGGCCGCCCSSDVGGGIIDDDGYITRLNSISGSMKPGTLTGVMGPSGSGKSTFLNVLCGKLEKTHGKIFVNHKEASLTWYKQAIGFVPQEDILDSQLTVREALDFSAKIRLRAPPKERNAVVDSTLKLLGLWDVKDSIIGDDLTRGISGGEKRRVSIGVELVARPAALFLDEPTTGLDATTAHNIMRLLRRIAEKDSVTVCAVIHQPRQSILNMCHGIVLLLKGGRLCFAGSVDRAVMHMEKNGFSRGKNVDIPDYLSDAISGLCSRKYPGHYEKDLEERENNITILASKSVSEELKVISNDNDGEQKGNANDKKGGEDAKQKVAAAEDPFKEVNGIAQFWHYFNRSGLLRFVRSTRSIEDLLSHVVAAIIIGLVFYSAPLFLDKIDIVYGRSCPAGSSELCTEPKLRRVGQFGFYNVMFLGLATMATASRTFGGGRKLIFWREASHGSSVFAYFLGENMIDVFSIALNTLFYTSIVQAAVPLEASLLMYWQLYFSLSFTVAGIAYIISIAIRDISNVIITGVIFAVILSLFEGFVGKIGDQAQWCYSHWAGRAASNIELIEGYNVNTTIPEYCTADARYGSEVNCFRDDDQQLISFYDLIVPEPHRSPDLMQDFAILLIIGFLVRIIAFAFLHLWDRGNRK